MTNTNLRSGWAPALPDAEIRIALPENAGYIGVEWDNTPIGFVFTQYNADKEPIAATDQHESLVGISQLFHLKDGARYAGLRLTQVGQSVVRMRVYSKGELPSDVKDFLAPYDKCDLMVISTHQDDEWIFFGGIIPYYQYVRGKDVQVVYMANCGRVRKNEALNGLWAAGVRHHPDFIDLKDENIASIDTALAHWGGSDHLIGLMVERIRRYQPEVVLTHDFAGEYGHKQHILTATHISSAILAAADPQSYPESYARYGAWQVKKLYIHLAKDCEIDFDWNQPYDELYGYTPLQVARKGYAEHKSQQKYYQVNDGGKYDNSRFGLTYSTVGWDELHMDLFENIDFEIENTAQPTAEPTPTAQPVAENTPEPTAQPTVSSEKKGGSAWRVIGIIGGVIGILALAVALRRRQIKRRRSKRRANRRYRY